jgi:hypothetical protein
LSVLGLAILAVALFIPRVPQPFILTGLPRFETGPSLPVLSLENGLAGKMMSRRFQGTPAPDQTKPMSTSIENLIRLSGIMDFGSKQPSLAIIEIISAKESKAYKSGDKVGETGIRVREIGETVIVEYENRRYRLTPMGVQELPTRALGTTAPGHSGD